MIHVDFVGYPFIFVCYYCCLLVLLFLLMLNAPALAGPRDTPTKRPGPARAGQQKTFKSNKTNTKQRIANTNLRRDSNANKKCMFCYSLFFGVIIYQVLLRLLPSPCFSSFFKCVLVLLFCVASWSPQPWLDLGAQGPRSQIQPGMSNKKQTKTIKPIMHQWETNKKQGQAATRIKQPLLKIVYVFLFAIELYWCCCLPPVFLCILFY